jgi:hypothetical protein
MQQSGQDRLRYWFNQYEKRDNKEYILVHVQGDSLCAMGEVLVQNWDKIQGLRGGAGYSGAELSGLRLAIAEQEEDVLVYRGLERILD